MKKVKFWIRRYFSFSQSQTNGFLFLLLVVVLAMLAPFIFYRTTAIYNPAKDQAELDSLVAQLEIQPEENKYSGSRPSASPASAKISLRPFNPNTLTPAEWLTLGVNRFTASNIIKYREKAGGFRYKEQLKRIYGMSPELYQTLEPYIQLPAQAENKNRYADDKSRARNYPDYSGRSGSSKAKYRLVAFDINSADTTDLKKINGIGTKLSARIVKFRDKLGGFTQPTQLAEVYGLSPEVLDSLQKYRFIQPGYHPKQINLNTATFEELRQHPYLNYNLARMIIAYRTQHGSYQTVDDLRNIKQINEQQLQKLIPYLQF